MVLASRKALHNSTVDTMTYAYDALQRLTSKTVQRSTGLTLAKEYSFKNLAGNRTTTQVSGYTAKVNETAIPERDFFLSRNQKTEKGCLKCFNFCI